MESALQFRPLAQRVKLPENYMPAALAALRGEPGTPGRLLLEQRTWDEEIDFASVTAAQMADPAHWAAPGPAAASPDAIFCLGQPLEAPSLRGARKLRPRAAMVPARGAGRRAAVVIIDHGIAFWNDRFRLGAGPGAPTRFQEVQFLSFEDQSGDDYAITALDKADLDALSALADTPGGQRQVMKTLAEMVPASFFGSAANPEGLWHGTAMADLAAGATRDAADDRMLFGLELPTAALRDWGGDTLQTLLLSALSAAVQMVSPVLRADAGLQEVVIVLAFGFPAGPQDGSHPAAALIHNFMDSLSQRLAGQGLAVRLVLPAGNHLQERGHARLPQAAPTSAATGAATGASWPAVTWRVAPDDNSANTLEICAQAGADPEVELVAPDGRAARVQLGAGEFAPLWSGGQIIGGLHRLPDRGGWAKLRLSLARTAWVAGAPRPAPFGDWALRVRAGSEVLVWALRDDRDVVADAATPHRPAVLVDPAYRHEDRHGAPVLDDLGAGQVRRAGSASILTTARHPLVSGVAAHVANPAGGTIGAAYSSLPFGPDTAFGASVQIGDAGFVEGVRCMANGGAREVRIQGTSAAAALHARALAGLD